MITAIHYKNFKALQDAILPLGRFTLIVGANGTGKSTALIALSQIESIESKNIREFLTKGLSVETNQIQIQLFWNEFSIKRTISKDTTINNFFARNQNNLGGNSGSFINSLAWNYDKKSESEAISDFRMFSFDSEKVAQSVPIQANTILKEDGRGLAGVLDRLRDSDPEIFEELNKELNRWFYEYDRILFEVPADGQKSFLLRTTVGKHKIKASELSDGTLLALAYLTIAYLPNPPKIVAFEEPEKGIHPRLLRNIQEAMYRLAYPENFGEKREPIQVIATTHSPYLLDLYKDNPEEIVISSKDEKGVHFERLIDKPHIKEILQDAPLGEIWYSGVLGGVPSHI